MQLFFLYVLLWMCNPKYVFQLLLICEFGVHFKIISNVCRFGMGHPIQYNPYVLDVHPKIYNYII